MKPERAVFAVDLHSLTFSTEIRKYDRIYAGAEFCPWRFPTLNSLQQTLDFARTHALPFTLVTPVLAEGFLSRLRATLRILLPQFSPADEVVISDWGGLPLVREISPHTPLLLGRTLSAQKRGGEILDLDLSPQQLDYFRQSIWSSHPALELLTEVGIARVEIDQPPQGLAPLPRGLRGTLHTPYAMVTSSRNCPFRPGGGDSGCAALCGEVFSLTTSASRFPLFQGGNTQFLRIDTLPDDLPSLGIDRLVVHSHLPR